MQALTDDFILEELILSNSVAVTSAFMFFAVEILDRFVVNETVGMDSTCNLRCGWIRLMALCSEFRPTISRSFIWRLIRVRQRVRITLAATDTIISIWNRSNESFSPYANITTNITNVNVHSKMTVNATRAIAMSINVGMILKRINCWHLVYSRNAGYRHVPQMCGWLQHHDQVLVGLHPSFGVCATQRKGSRDDQRIAETSLQSLYKSGILMKLWYAPRSEYCITGAQRHWEIQNVKLKVNQRKDRHTSRIADRPPLPWR